MVPTWRGREAGGGERHEGVGETAWGWSQSGDGGGGGNVKGKTVEGRGGGEGGREGEREWGEERA